MTERDLHRITCYIVYWDKKYGIFLFNVHIKNKNMETMKRKEEESKRKCTIKKQSIQWHRKQKKNKILNTNHKIHFFLHNVKCTSGKSQQLDTRLRFSSLDKVTILSYKGLKELSKSCRPRHKMTSSWLN